MITQNPSFIWPSRWWISPTLIKILRGQRSTAGPIIKSALIRKVSFSPYCLRQDGRKEKRGDSQLETCTCHEGGDYPPLSYYLIPPSSALLPSFPFAVSLFYYSSL